MAVLWAAPDSGSTAVYGTARMTTLPVGRPFGPTGAMTWTRSGSTFYDCTSATGFIEHRFAVEEAAFRIPSGNSLNELLPAVARHPGALERFSANVEGTGGKCLLPSRKGSEAQLKQAQPCREAHPCSSRDVAGWLATKSPCSSLAVPVFMDLPCRCALSHPFSAATGRSGHGS